ncbi:GIY-YIG nuclease family protein [bacterium]|nr:MAG: GIY-YIG nuclease family protein [bacterium]
MAIIYRAKCNVKSKDEKTPVYVGQTKNELEQRIEQHKQKVASNISTPFYNALRNYGFESFVWDILCWCKDEEVEQKEQFFIDSFACDPYTEILNVSGSRKNKSNEILKNINNKLVIESEKLGELSLREAGRLKPVVNLLTKKVHSSLQIAAKIDEVSVDQIRNSSKTGKMLPGGVRYAFISLDNKPILTPGHSQEIFIGKNAKKVKDLVSGKIYDSVVDAAQKCNLSSSVVDGGARGEYAIVKDRYVFCFLDNQGQEKRLARHDDALQKLELKKGFNYCAWGVDNLEREGLQKFKTLDEMCQKLGLKSKSHVKSVLDGVRSHVEKWRIARWDQKSEQPVLTEKHFDKPSKVSRSVICLNDEGRKFPSVAEAGKFYGVDAQGVAKCCNGRAKSVYRLNDGLKKKERLLFAYSDDQGQPKLTPTHHLSATTLAARGDQRILLTNEDKIKKLGRDRFNSLSEFCRVTKVPRKRAAKHLQDKSVYMFGFDFVTLD